MKLLSILLLTLATITGSYAQQNDTLPVGQKIFPAKTIPQNDKYILYWDMPDGKWKPIALATNSVESLSFHGKQTWAYIQKYQGERGINTDTTFFEESTLLPIAYRTDINSSATTQITPYKEIVDFGPAGLTGSVIYRDSVKTAEKNIALAYFNAPMEEYIISRLPLHQNYTTVFKLVSVGKNTGEIYSRINVLDAEEIMLPDHQKIVCWKLEVNNGFSKSYLWFSKKEQKFIKRKFGNEKRGIFWKIRML